MNRLFQAKNNWADKSYVSSRANIGLVFVQTAPAPNVEPFKSISTIKTANQSDRR